MLGNRLVLLLFITSLIAGEIVNSNENISSARVSSATDIQREDFTTEGARQAKNLQAILEFIVNTQNEKMKLIFGEKTTTSPTTTTTPTTTTMKSAVLPGPQGL